MYWIFKYWISVPLEVHIEDVIHIYWLYFADIRLGYEDAVLHFNWYVTICDNYLSKVYIDLPYNEWLWSMHGSSILQIMFRSFLFNKDVFYVWA